MALKTHVGRIYTLCESQHFWFCWYRSSSQLEHVVIFLSLSHYRLFLFIHTKVTNRKQTSACGNFSIKFPGITHFLQIHWQENFTRIRWFPERLAILMTYWQLWQWTIYDKITCLSSKINKYRSCILHK